MDKSQNKQKQQHDRISTVPKYRVGDTEAYRVFVYTISREINKDRYLRLSSYVPYRILELTDANVGVTLWDTEEVPDRSYLG